MLSFCGSSGNIDTLELRNIVAFFILDGATLGADVLSCLTLTSELCVAFLPRNCFLYRSLGDLTLALLDISTHGVGDIMALPPGDGVVHGLGNLLTDFLGDLAAHGLRGSCPDHGRGVTLEGDLEESQEKGGCENSLHLGWMR